MFIRLLQRQVLKSAKQYRALALVGPRQSGKTTLAKMVFPDYAYISLENPDQRQRALQDPRNFLSGCKSSTILDEVQNTPELFSYLQEILDDKKDPRQFILTGSNRFQLNEKISQSLAGRIRIFTVLPLMFEELPKDPKAKYTNLDTVLSTGMYPRIYDENLDPQEWFQSYYETYLQKDIKMITNISDVNQFDRFVRLCAGRCGQLGEYSSLASDAGISQPTAFRWASVLESSFITFRLPPHFENFNKRIIKTPKVYFYDTGLLCQLLRIHSSDQLNSHSLRGSIFENFVVAEFMKYYFNRGITPALYFWRDKHGHEVDLLVDKGGEFISIEIKSGMTFQAEWLKSLQWFGKLPDRSKSYLIFGGRESFEYQNIPIEPWTGIFQLAETVSQAMSRLAGDDECLMTGQ